MVAQLLGTERRPDTPGLLLEACASGDVNRALTLLEGGASLISDPSEFLTPWNALMVRSDFASLALLAHHPNSGVDANFLDEQLRRRVTDLGSTEDRVGDIVKLRALGALPLTQDESTALRAVHRWAMNWPLHAAASFDMHEVCCELLRQGYNPREESESVQRPATPLDHAVRQKAHQTIDLLSAWLAREEAMKQLASLAVS